MEFFDSGSKLIFSRVALDSNADAVVVYDAVVVVVVDVDAVVVVDVCCCCL